MYENLWICAGTKVYQIRILVQVKTAEKLFFQLASGSKKGHFQT